MQPFKRLLPQKKGLESKYNPKNMTEDPTAYRAAFFKLGPALDDNETRLNTTSDSLFKSPARTKRRNNASISMSRGSGSVDTDDGPVLSADIEYQVLSMALCLHPICLSKGQAKGT